MLNLKQISLSIIALVLTSPVLASLDLSATVNCTYHTGQMLSKSEATNVNNSTPLKWAFNGLKSEKPIFVSGGDTGKVHPVPIESGVIIYLPYPVGTSTFTIWSTGESFWSKQANIVGTVYSQQFIGSCVN